MGKPVILATKEVNSDILELSFNEFSEKYPLISINFYYRRREQVKSNQIEFLYPEWVGDEKYQLYKIDNLYVNKTKAEENSKAIIVPNFYIQQPDEWTLVGGIGGRWYPMTIKRSKRI